MKNGDTVPVTIAGQVVANATVREVSEGEVTLVVPATLVRMATRTELAPPTPQEMSSTESVIVGVDSPADNSSDAVVVEQVGAETPQTSLPQPTDPGETANVAESPVADVEQVSPVVSDDGNANAEPRA